MWSFALKLPACLVSFVFECLLIEGFGDFRDKALADFSMDLPVEVITDFGFLFKTSLISQFVTLSDFFIGNIWFLPT